MPSTIGRYQILTRLGPAQDNEVYKGFDPMIERPIVVKVFSTARSDAANTDVARRLFFSEMQRAGALDHPGIVTIFDAGEIPGAFFLATEFIEGSSLNAALDRGLTLPLPERVSVLAQLGDALEYARQRGVRHLGLEPANVLIGADASLKIRGFGEAAVIRALSANGPATSSPDETTNARAEALTDVAALGRLAQAVLADQLADDAALPVRPVIERALASQTTASLPTAGAFRDALLRAMGMDDLDVRLAWDASHWMAAARGPVLPTGTDQAAPSDETRLLGDTDPGPTVTQALADPPRQPGSDPVN